MQTLHLLNPLNIPRNSRQKTMGICQDSLSHSPTHPPLLHKSLAWETIMNLYWSQSQNIWIHHPQCTPYSWRESSGGPTFFPARGSSTVLLWRASTRHLGMLSGWSLLIWQQWTRSLHLLFLLLLLPPTPSPLPSFTYRPIMGLEYSQYLENYLWPHFTVERVRPEFPKMRIMSKATAQGWWAGIGPRGSMVHIKRYGILTWGVYHNGGLKKAGSITSPQGPTT